MNRDTLDFLACNHCSQSFKAEEFESNSINQVKEGILRCLQCKVWYPISNGIANFLPANLADHSKRVTFRKKWNLQLESSPTSEDSNELHEKKKQIEFFDADTHIYDENMENTPFWKANDWNCLKDWLPRLGKDDLLLDVGCGTGRASTPFAQNGVRVIGLDISEQMVLRAKKKGERLGMTESIDYVVGDSENLHFKKNSFDAVLAFGVLHHVPTPQIMLGQMSKVLKDGGLYFGHENNKTILRPIFDLLMFFSRLWIEEAGNHPLISKPELREWAEKVNLDVKIKSSVFLPPHLYNLLGYSGAKRLINYSDKLFNKFPIIQDTGGVLIIEGQKN